MQSMPIMLIGVTSYSFKDRESGQLLQGAKVRGLAPVGTEYAGRMGYEQVEFPAPYDAANSLILSAQEILNGSVVAPAILKGEFQKKGRSMVFVASGLVATK